MRRQGDSDRIDGGTDLIDAPGSTSCDPECPDGYVCEGGDCVPESDVDGDGVPSGQDCDDASASVGRMAERPCSSACSAGVERCLDGRWNPCTAPTDCDCTDGDAPRMVSCMECGMQRQVCDGGTWRDEGTCSGGGTCPMGDVEMGGTCGRCGVQARTCGVTCTWGAWSCSEEGECTPGAEEMSEEACGACNTGHRSRTRTCDGTCGWGAWSDFGACSGASTECAAGASDSESRACPGGCANQTRTRSCSSTSCTWGAFGSWSTCPTCGPVCGNGTCESGETCASCADCRYGHMGSGTGGSSCAGVPAETWRCVTTSVCGGPTSQVCRGGTWINFNCAPRNCSACRCSYSISCDQ